MATIFPRETTFGATWRVQIRRKGLPYFHISFNTKREAKIWAREHEQKYIENPDKYLEEKDSLKEMREREFLRR